MKCQNCGKVTILYAPICSSCGYNIMKSNEEQNKNKISSLHDSNNISYCPNCGKKIIIGSNYCTYCEIEFINKVITKNKVITNNMKVVNEYKNRRNDVIQNKNSGLSPYTKLIFVFFIIFTIVVSIIIIKGMVENNMRQQKESMELEGLNKIFGK